MKQTKFEKFSFQPFLIEAIKDLNFYEPTEIQERIIPSLLNGESAIGQSQTGTGKTHAYLLPILNKINPHKDHVQAVIMAPTRELALQIHEEVQKITVFTEEDAKITSKCLIGGTDKQRTIEKLKQQPHVVVGTPSRIHDLMQEGALSVRQVDTIVVDEADLMLDLGFIEDVDRIAAAMKEDVQILVFSATIPEKLKPFLKKYLDNPRYTHVAPKQLTAAKLEHILVPQRHRDKKELVYNMLTNLNPYLAIVFANTKKSADELADHLLEKGLKVARIHGGLEPRERKRSMKQIQDLQYQYIVATDLAARGIDIQGVSHVINYEIPQDLDFYVHRVGRTARAGYDGTAITIYEQDDYEALMSLENRGIEFLNKDLERNEWIEVDDRNKRRKRVRQEDEVEKTARKFIRKPAKVKPGYKKKRQREIDRYVKKQKRNTRNSRKK
ncbi:DEAD/DEAH box helicase [Priestia endophytica]|jgi:ATP-dependent RNA helicase CshB|uniref:DEAD-box ATP-dependent RNA helicase CshB n=1 Tax=Priestia endophytica DSM 13796 TaxID=1121089 RepID=A0A1I5WEL0_9BACI|nr:DEAD/DEAH box helicase [Priestia endophytica]KYG36101.1 DEAD/DEAH box helicase [Priestia endophytica]MBG9815042.1 DEAD/DEAH box helicase [Priestia endophytica]RAS88757.1 DEAD/DEAH box helicase [Priestia endophytica]SFQ18145.1 ATP-dependent RNA helicase CshB [Priestia endophytica DSM 13796]